HPQSRPDRGQLRPLRPGDGHRAARRLPVALPRLRPPRAPLGARRLANPAVAVPLRPRPRRPRRAHAAPEPAAGAGALEDFRQPAPQPGAAGAGAAPGAGLDGAARRRLALDAAGAVVPGGAAAAAAGRLRRQPGAGWLVAAVHPAALPVAAPLLAAWFLSPLVAYWVSRPTIKAESPLTAEERRELRRVARKTWHFFETFVTAEDNWLPPDNYQESPK